MEGSLALLYKYLLAYKYKVYTFQGAKISHMSADWCGVEWSRAEQSVDAVWVDSLKIILEYFVDEFIDLFD